MSSEGARETCDCTSDGSWESEITVSSHLEDECNGAAHGAVSDEPSTRIHDYPYLNQARAASELGNLFGVPVRAVGRRLADLSAAPPTSSGAPGNFDAKSCDDILSPLSTGNGRRDLLPLPCVNVTMEELSLNGVAFGESQPFDPSFDEVGVSTVWKRLFPPYCELQLLFEEKLGAELLAGDDEVMMT